MNRHPVQNPVLRGFNPDPSLVKVEDVYYMATSTFEWFPGIQVHRSNDLTEWALVARPLDEKRLLDIVGVPDSCGVWAPCLSFANGLFYLAYTVVKRF
ncbi:MAG: family 43 glycosylhydrolase, partial [Halieaceae bacterium]|nr:family 43 glycosylhydrolase [Halieaceae bacterium]